MKLNLGCGQHKINGYINVDRDGDADVLHDLETFPWPWMDSSIEEIAMLHVLEHLGAEHWKFIAILKELYRVSIPNGLIKIVVPHPRHDFFLCDPTHVRPITGNMFKLFSKRLNREWAKTGFSNSPLGLYYNVDFEVENIDEQLDRKYELYHKLTGHSDHELQFAKEHLHNVIAQTEILLRVVKD